MSQDDINGYTVAYDRDEIQFPVYVVMAIGVAALARAAVIDSFLLASVGFAALGYGFYNFPLLETGRPRLGAGQYGVFLDGLGIIAWRAINDIEVAVIDHRGVVHRELNLILARPLDAALIADWRERPYHRFLMRLPWSSKDNITVRVPLDVFDQPADTILATLVRMKRFYGG